MKRREDEQCRWLRGSPSCRSPPKRSPRGGYTDSVSCGSLPPRIRAGPQRVPYRGSAKWDMTGRNVVIEYRWARTVRGALFPPSRPQLVRLNPGTVSRDRRQRGPASHLDHPIVIGVRADPVGLGQVKSLAKPGGTRPASPPRSSILLEAPRVAQGGSPETQRRRGLVAPHSSGARKGLAETEITAQKLGVRVRSYGVIADSTALEPAFARHPPRPAGWTHRPAGLPLSAGTARASPPSRQATGCRRWSGSGISLSLVVSSPMAETSSRDGGSRPGM